MVRRNRLRKKGRIQEANRLAEKINICIQDTRSKHYSKLTQASPKELWAAVKTTNGSVTHAQYPSDIMIICDKKYRVSNLFCELYVHHI